MVEKQQEHLEQVGTREHELAGADSVRTCSDLKLTLTYDSLQLRCGIENSNSYFGEFVRRKTPSWIFK